MSIRTLAFALACCLLGGPGHAWAQSSTDYDASWYDPDAPYVQIDVTADGVYRVSAATLQSALPEGRALSDISRNEIQLFENGTEIPIQVTGDPDGTLTPSDSITFVGHRNRGTDEHWAYDYSRGYDQRAQSSTYYSLYADTTTYWMTWGNERGRRYEKKSPSTFSSATTALRDTLHAEQDNLYYFGRPNENGNARYTFSEGYYWRRFSHNDTSPITFTHTLAVGRRTATSTELDLSIRLVGTSSNSGSRESSCHRVEVEARLQQSTGSPAFESLTSVEWKDLARQTITTSIQQDRIPEGGLELRLTSYNSDFSSSDCAPPSNTLNRVLLDWIEAAYTRSLEATNNTQRFVAPAPGAQAFSLSGHSGNTVHVYNPEDAHRFEASLTEGTATVVDTPRTADTPYWAVGTGGFRSPAAVRPDSPSNWSAPSNAADYLILTTPALRPSAQNLADYRRSEDGYQVEIALVQNVFDEFDYGRPTPIAIRRFVRATQDWDVQPRFLTIFGDAQYPIDDGSVSSLYPEWSVPSFGYSPSDGWFAMQTGGAEDWSELLAVGRIPVRSNAQGNLFLDKLQSYESAPLERWQKRMLLLAGGTTQGEQDQLQFYSNMWGEIAADTFATTRNYNGPVHTGMDTSRYYKKVNAPLDASFQDSLSVDLGRGAGWVNYFGHSSAQTWEIVTDPPSDFDNAGRLPVVSSIGCRTGSFAGGRGQEKSAPSLGEQLVVGSVRSDGTPQDGARNGAIAHFGESALGFRGPSARINDALIRRVFVDTVRVLGEAVRQAKAEVNTERGDDSFYAKHLLQYGLLGDPATKMALPKRPDLHVASNLISVSPTAPTASDNLTVTVEVQNRGLIPSDSVDLDLTWTRPDGSTVRRARRLQRFPRKRKLTFTFSLTEQALGTNRFRVTVDPDDQYEEAIETNNAAEQTQVVFDSGVSLISPSDFGTVTRDRPALTVSVSRQADESVPVVLQLDSVPDFSSPARREIRRDVDALQNTWRPSSLDEGTTYYWRARIDDDSRDTWKSSQFTVASTLPEGSWLQQGRLFTSNANTRLDRSARQWRFATFDRNVSTMSERGNGSRPDGFVIDGASDYGYLTFGFGVLVMDDLTGQVRASKSFPTYALVDRFEEDFSEVGDQQEATDSLAAFLDRVPQQGDYVFVRTRHLARESSATIVEEVKDLLRTLGTDTQYSDVIDNDFSYRHVWVMKARKGHPDETVERVSPPSEASEVNEIILESRPSFPRPSGTTLTSPIGPASDWSTLTWKGRTPESGDALRIAVLARDSTVLVDDLTGASGQASLDQIDATKHPFLRLRAALIDSTARTSPQLTQWSLSYEGVPELAVDPAGLRGSVPDTLRQGQEATLSLPVANLGSTSSNSVRVQYSVTDADNTARTFARDTLQAIEAGARDTSTASLNTADLPGLNVLTVSVESDGPPERLTNNNTAIQNVFVQRDETPPSLNVRTNGRPLPPTPDPINNLRSPNLPFVSAQPTFEIHLRDDNPNLPLTDTSHVTVYLKDGLPSQSPIPISDFQRISYASDQLTLISPDSSAANSLRVLFEPSLASRDSTYTLKVEARDTQDNKIDPYQAAFRIQQEQVIKDVYPYPNPMNTHTTFAFRVEGGQDKMLRDFALRIYTLSGRLVRELTETDLEKPLGVGWNTLRWNGRDADGDRVATGVYLYRVRIEGDEQTFRGDVEKVTVIR